jgi:elongation factor P hydroxylase
MGVLAFNLVLLLAQSLVLLKFPVKGLLVITTERVMLLGRIPRHWLMLRTVEKNLPVRILMTFRTIDVLMRWQTGKDTFVIAVDLHDAMELKAFLSEHFPHWQWEGDRVMPAWRQRLQREGLWRLALLLALTAWIGWVWHQSSLRLKVLFLQKDIWEMSQDERKHHLQQLELALKLLPNEPLVHAIYADALFAIGEWEKAAQERQHLLPTDFWRLIERLMSREEQWRKEVAKKFDESDWRFDAAIAEKFVALMLKRGEVTKANNFFAYRAIVWLKRSIQKGAPKEVSDAVEFLETAVAKHKLDLLKKAQDRLQLALRK